MNSFHKFNFQAQERTVCDEASAILAEDPLAEPEQDQEVVEDQIEDLTDPFSDDLPLPHSPVDLRVQVSAKGRTVYPGIAVLRQDTPITTEPAASAGVELTEV